MVTPRPPILGIAAYSGTGKTTLLRKILPQLRGRGLRVAVVKHAHHSFDTDVPGKDSYELRKAGAVQMLVASRHRWALITETGDANEPRLDELLGQLDQSNLDLILVEGFKAEAFPKIE
ncbi:MAG: molybdopterin-guanine dinucleotide biosynthesis protein B, partial [Sulfurifustis sp.]